MGNQSNEPNPMLPAVIAAGISAYGDLRAAAGKPEEGLALKTMAPMLSYTAAGHLVWARRQAERVVFSLRRIFHRAEEEGIVEQLEEAADLLEQAIPLISNEPSADKRRMMEEIVLNGARRAGEYGALVGAQEALSDVERLSPGQALVFAHLCHELDHVQWSDRTVHRDRLVETGLAEYRIHQALGKLTGGGGPHLVHGGPSAVVLGLTDHGETLAGWIRANPSSAPDQQR